MALLLVKNLLDDPHLVLTNPSGYTKRSEKLFELLVQIVFCFILFVCNFLLVMAGDDYWCAASTNVQDTSQT